MKRLLLTLAIAALAGSALPRAEAADVSFDFFYNNVSGGTWIDVADYGYCWQPDVARSSSWRPYTDGYWAYSDVGWTWVSYEDFGWATYHYGRWVRLSDRGWVWVVGRDNELEWGPAWVSWRTGGDRIGWAPLPPRGRNIVARGRIFGHVDVDFDIGPSYYNFVDVRYIGEPVLRERIYEPSQNVTYIRETVNVTNITYQNNVVYNYGPDYNAVVARSSRPIPRLTIERQANVDPSTAVKSGALVKVEGQKLIVAAPAEIKPGAKMAPPAVKEKIASAQVDRGWAGTDAKAQEDLKKKIQTEDATKVPTPSASASVAAQTGAAASPSPSASATATATAAASATASASPALSASPRTSPSVAPSATPSASASPALKGKKGAFSPSPAASTSPAATASPAKGKKGTASEHMPGMSPAASASPATTPDLGKSGKGKRSPSLAPAVSPSATPASTPALNKGKSKLESSTPASSPASAGPTAESQGKAKKSIKPEATMTPPATGDQPLGHGGGKKAQALEQNAVGGGEGSHGKQMKDAETTSAAKAPAGPGAAGASSEGKKEKSEGGKKADKKADEPTASPTP